MTRVALLGPTHPYKGGIAQHTTQLAHELAARGHQVEVVSWSAQYPARLYPGEQRVAEPELPVFPATSYPLSWRWPPGWWRTGRRLRDRADVVVVVLVTPLQVPAWLTVIRALSRRPRVVALCHNVLPHERRKADERLVRAVLRRVDGVLVHSEDQRRLAQSLAPTPVAVGVMPPHHPFVAAPPGDDRPVHRRLLFFGLVRPYKGLDVLLRALAEVPDVSLVVAGEFWQGVEDTEQLVAELGLQDRVELRPGYVDAAEVPALFARADALVLPYRAATGSQNPTIAHELGIPVVATTVGRMAEQVAHDEDGLLCEPEDPAGLAAALRHLYEPGVIERLRAGIVAAPAGAQWGAYVDALMSLSRQD